MSKQDRNDQYYFITKIVCIISAGVFLFYKDFDMAILMMIIFTITQLFIINDKLKEL